MPNTIYMRFNKLTLFYYLIYHIHGFVPSLQKSPTNLIRYLNNEPEIDDGNEAWVEFRDSGEECVVSETTTSCIETNDNTPRITTPGSSKRKSPGFIPFSDDLRKPYTTAKYKTNADSEECSVEDMYEDKSNAIIDKNDKIDKIVNRFTILDCFLALLFGAPWNPDHFWKEVRNTAIKDSFKSILIITTVITLITYIKTNIDISALLSN